MKTITIDKTIETKQAAIALDQVNKVNETFYNEDVKHIITISVSNSINPTFEVYATCLQYALDELGIYLLENELNSLYYTYDDMDELQDEDGEIQDNFYQCDNSIFLDMDRIYSN